MMITVIHHSIPWGLATTQGERDLGSYGACVPHCTVYVVWLSALVVQWLGHLVVAEETWVRFPPGANKERFCGCD
jgi:hypothetical protein